MPPLSNQILQNIEVLPEEDQRQVLDFVEFLKVKRLKTSSPETQATQSFLESAQSIIGMGEGPGDLSTNPVYMNGYGE